MNSTKLYLHTEYQKAYSKTSIPFRATKAATAMGGKIANVLVNMITDYAKKQYQQLDCLNEEARSKHICEIIGEVFIPTAGILALLKNGIKATKKYVNLRKLLKESTPKEVLTKKSFERLTQRYPLLRYSSQKIGKTLTTVSKINHSKQNLLSILIFQDLLKVRR